jgi:SH3 domain protein
MSNKHLLLILLMAASNGAYAEISNENSYYITDHVQIPMRSDKTFDNNIIEKLSSGSQLEVLDISKDGRWTQVQHKDLKGWVISKYIIDRPSARSKLKQKVILSKVLNFTNRKLSSDLKDLQNKYNKLLADGGNCVK